MEFGNKENIETPSIMYRFRELFFDWLFICGYLILLLIITFTIYLLVFNDIPEFTNLQSQLIAMITSVVPIIIIFSIMEGSRNYASWGKIKTNLKVKYKGLPWKGSIIRNTFKFLPWQFGHMSTINGIYNGFDTPFSMIFFTLSITLFFIYILMVITREDNRHLADIIAGSIVVKNL